MAYKMFVANDRNDWLDLRRRHIGGSDIAPIMLEKKYRPKWMMTPVELWMDKTGRTADRPETAAMRRGVALEDPTAQRYARRMGFAVQSCPTLVDGHFSANIDRLVSMPDAPAVSDDGERITAKRILECKTAAQAWGEQIPVYYYGQPQWYMGFLPDCESADVACWFDVMCRNEKAGEPDPDFAVYHIARDQDFIDAAREKAAEFMEKYVLPDVMPPVESEGEARIKWAVSKDGLDPVVASAEIEKAVAEIHGIDEETERLKAEREARVAEVMKAMGDNPFLKSAGGRMLVSWKSSRPRTTIDWKGIAQVFEPSDSLVREYTHTADCGSRPFKLLGA
jgi:putative phage-type endonuclease